MIGLILTLALVGFLVWAIVTYIPMPDIFKKVIIIIVVVAMILWLLSIFGFTDIPVPHYRRS